MARYLVMFVSDPATDEHAAVLRALVRGAVLRHAWAGPEPGFFDQLPADGDVRTTGVFLRVDDAPGDDARAVGALVEDVAAAGGRLGVRIEVQLAERVLGHLVAGRPDAEVLAALREHLDVVVREP